MIGVVEQSIVAVVVASIATVGGYFSYRAAKNSKTENGHTMGEQVDNIREDVAAIRVWMMEHLRDHANHGER